MLRKLTYVFTALLVVSCVVSASAQVTWMNQFRGTCFSLSLNKAVGDSGLSDLADYTAIFTGYFGFTEKLHIIVQLPYASTSDYDSDSALGYLAFPYRFTSGTIGNPYIGIELIGDRKDSRILQLGVRIPNVSPKDDNIDYAADHALLAAVNGMAISPEQYEAFAPKLFAAQIAIGKQFYRDKDIYYLNAKILGGVTFMRNLDTLDNVEQFGIDFNPELWVIRRSVEFGVGFNSRINMTETDKDFSDRITSQFGFAVNGVFKRMRLGMHARLPSVLGGKADDNISFLFGVHVILDLQ